MEDSLLWKAHDGIQMFARSWDVQATDRRGAVCLIHGLGEHSGRYDRVATHLMSHGFSVLAPDLRGHGKSGGRRGHIDRYDAFMQDIDSCMEMTRSRFPGIPLLLYGHSMGGNLVLNYALKKTPDVAGVIATGPWLRLAFSPPPLQVLLARAMAALWPSFTSDNGLKSSAMTHDSDINRRYDDDPYVHRKITARLFTEIERSGRWSLEHADQFSVPLLIIHGAADQVTSCAASGEFAERAPQCTFCAWKGLYHEVHNEPEGDSVLDFICEWMSDQLQTTEAMT